MKNIILCGFMGCGKSTVGRALSQLADMKFIDTDSFIEENKKMTISEIFEKFGEKHFRLLEKEAAEKLSDIGGFVIATGGGMLLNSEIAEIFKKNGDIVFLDTPLSIILDRLKNDSSRPLLMRPDRDEYIPKLHRERYPKYLSAANIKFDTSNLTAFQSAKQILEIIKNQRM